MGEERCECGHPWDRHDEDGCHDCDCDWSVDTFWDEQPMPPPEGDRG